MTLSLWGTPDKWHYTSLGGVEDLREAIIHADLSPVQLSRMPSVGTLALAEFGGLGFSTGAIGGKINISGPLSADCITLGTGLYFPPGCRQWQHDVETGSLAIFMPGDVHDALYVAGAMYAAVTLSFERLEQVAADLEVSINIRKLGGSGIYGGRLAPGLFARMQHLFQEVHTSGRPSGDAAGALLFGLVTHFGTAPAITSSPSCPPIYGSVLSRAREYIHEHASESMSVADIAKAAGTSPRTLHRAFRTLLDETPYSYVHKMRLARMRADIIRNATSEDSLAQIANRWGISELGRAAHEYRRLFGELPSRTRAHAKKHDA